MEPTAATIRECLGSLVFGEEDDELEDAVVRLLAETPANAVPRSSAAPAARWPNGCSRAAGERPHYLGGQVVHSPAMLVQLLGQSVDLVARHGPASREVAEAMAADCRRQQRRRFRAGRGSVSGRRRRAARDRRFISAWRRREGDDVKASSLLGHPSIWIPRAGKAALNLLRLTLLGEI